MILVSVTPDIQPRAATTVYVHDNLGDYYYDYDESFPAPAEALLIAQAMQHAGYNVSWVDYDRQYAGEATVFKVDGAFWVESEGRLFSNAPLYPTESPEWQEVTDPVPARLAEVFPNAAVLHRRFTRGRSEGGPAGAFWTRHVGTTELI